MSAALKWGAHHRMGSGFWRVSVESTQVDRDGNQLKRPREALEVVDLSPDRVTARERRWAMVGWVADDFGCLAMSTIHDSRPLSIDRLNGGAQCRMHSRHTLVRMPNDRCWQPGCVQLVNSRRSGQSEATGEEWERATGHGRLEQSRTSDLLPQTCRKGEFAAFGCSHSGGAVLAHARLGGQLHNDIAFRRQVSA